MKKLILILLLLTCANFAQTSTILLLFDDGGYKNPETTLYLAGLTTPISPTYAATLDSFITKVKDSLSITSLSQKFDVMYDLGGYNQEQSLRNIVKRSHDATAVDSPTFTQWEGFTGNGTSSYLNTNYNPNTQGVNYTQNVASLGVYSRTSTARAGVDIGLANSSDGTQQINMSTRYTGDHLYGRINSTNAEFSDYTNTDGSGFYVLNRLVSTEFLMYKNGTMVETQASTSQTITSGNVYVLGANYGTPTAFSVKQISFAFIGAGLTATEVRKLTNCVEWLMDRKGTGVIP